MHLEEIPTPPVVARSQDLATTSSADLDPAATAPRPQPQTADTSSAPAGCIPPPLIDNTAACAGAITDNVDDFFASYYIADPYKQPVPTQPQSE
ncbi:hypothetical protein AX14_000371 [Amanita brunnescens Koide BX004]|nr:hypothetical protein AX14_000371 [Amanita brunnescens Koide BX004]